jgi:ferredoxin
MKIWIDQQLCTGNGICAEIAPEVIVMQDGLAYVTDGVKVLADGQAGMAAVPADLEEDVIEAAEVCPAECIYLEA